MIKLFSFGNRKLPSTTMVFNITAATDCKSDSLNLCQLANSNACYAKKAERMYKAVLPYRRKQAEFWDRCTAQSFVTELLQNKGKRKIKHLRLNEAGDFRSQKDILKAEKIAKMLKMHGIQTYCYTARKDLDFSKCNTLVVNGSGFMVHNSFTVFPRKTDLTKLTGTKICARNCRICNMCMNKSNLKIVTELH